MRDSGVLIIEMGVIGGGLGLLFFGGLWLSLRYLPRSKSPHLLLLGSAIVRTTAILWGLWYFSGGDPMGVVAGVGGFTALQLLATYSGAAAAGSSKSKAPR